MNVFYKFLELKGIPFNKRTASDFLATHPYHPGILSLSDLLDEFKTENAAVEVLEDDLEQVPLPFIAQTSSADGDFALVTQLNSQAVTYLNEKGKWHSISLNAFKKIFAGIVLVAEKGAASGEENYTLRKKEINRSMLKKTGMILLLTVLLCCFYGFNTMPGAPALCTLLFILKLSGLAVSILLLLHTFDAQNPALHKLCSSSSGNGCNDVLSSSGSKIFKGSLSWSEVGFFYFSTTVLSLILNGTGGCIALIFWLNIACLPFTLYAVWYQKYRVGSWCRLCLATHALLWLEFFTGMAQPSLYRHAVTFRDAAVICGTGMLLMVLWLLIRPVIEQSVTVHSLSRVANKFKRSEFIFNTLLGNQEQTDIRAGAPLILGSPDARYEITIVSNPFCQPCMLAHQQIKNLMEQCPGKLRLSIIFISSGSEQDKKDLVIHKLIKEYLNHGPQQFGALLDSWYDPRRKSVERWLEKQAPADQDTPGLDHIIAAQMAFCVTNNISHTPTLYINGYKAIPEYDLSDLKPFIQSA